MSSRASSVPDDLKRRLLEPITLVLRLIARKQYAELVRITNGVRLSEVEIARAVSEYGGTVIEPPDRAFDFLDIVRVRGKDLPTWSVSIPVWTKEEGRSDLSVSLTIVDRGDRFDIELDDLHVL